jgi:UDP-N-acetylglucosamine--N-acetylmuramyl-(pentapeptide) pyrophosphoryl-undecaprenol N-acetylglucosamine transferase
MGVGGYSSGPVVMAAALRRIPTLVLEQNAVPGLTNRLLAPWVRAAAVTYEQTQSFFRGKAFVTGNPVRAEFFQTSNDERRTTNGRTLLVLGGSQGAHAINVAMMAAAAPLMQRVHGLSLVHQTGERDLAEVRSVYQRAGVTARVEPFLSAVAREMAEADVVISRAGATTLAELAAAGRAALLIPFPGASDDHQRRNAELLAAAHACTVIDERDLTTDRLVDVTAGLVEDDERRARMATSMRGFARPDAAAQIVDRILALAGPSGRQAA